MNRITEKFVIITFRLIDTFEDIVLDVYMPTDTAVIITFRLIDTFEGRDSLCG